MRPQAGPPTDEELVASVRAGRQGSFDALAARYQTRLTRFCWQLLRSREDAEDALQDVLTAAFNAILADDRTIHVQPWLYRIARNRCINQLRRARMIGVDSMDDHPAEHWRTVVEKVVGRQRFRELIGDVQALPDSQRTALLLCELDGFSYLEIALAISTTVPAVKSLLVRARANLLDDASAREGARSGTAGAGTHRRRRAPARGDPPMAGYRRAREAAISMA